MKYALMITDFDGRWEALADAERARIMEGHQAFHAALREDDRFVASFRLRGPREARTVRKTDGDGRVVNDGPYAETKEVMGGIYVIEAPTIEDAVGWAKRIPLGYGAVEVRPVWE